MKRLGKIIFVSLVLLCISGCAKEDYSANQISNSKFEKQSQIIDTYLNESHFQGAVLIAKSSEIMYAQGFGPCDKRKSDINPITINSVFEVGSITKQMTAAAIMQLREKKLLSLEEPISTYFPNYQYGNDITIKMLLTMRSGIVDYINATDDFFPKNICKQIDKKMYANKKLEDGLVLKYLNNVPLMFKPGSTYFYSNTNYYLLAKIIEQVSGQSYEEYLQKNIFEPLQMKNTNAVFGGTDTRGYDWKGRSYFMPKELAFGCGDINSTVIDLYKWNVGFINGKVVSKKSYKEMINTQSYGYGINNQHGEIFHSGVTETFNSYNCYYPKSKYSIVILINKPVSEINASVISREIYKIIMGNP